MGNHSKTESAVAESPAAQMPEKRLTRRGRATRAALIEGGKRAFAERGFDGARVADVVKNAGVAQGNFYRHFEHKDALLFAILEPLYEELQKKTGQAGMQEPVHDQASLARRNFVYFDYYRGNRHLFRVAREAAASAQSDVFRDLWLSMRSSFLARNRAWLNGLVRSGRAIQGIDTEIVADALGNMTEQMAYTRIALPADAPDDDELRRMSNSIAHIWWRAVFPDEPQT